MSGLPFFPEHIMAETDVSAVTEKLVANIEK